MSIFSALKSKYFALEVVTRTAFQSIENPVGVSARAVVWPQHVYVTVVQMYICIISCHALYLAIHCFIVCVNSEWKGITEHHHFLYDLVSQCSFNTFCHYCVGIISYCI